jgi:lipopolysaccharide transport system ATP-binding protein
MSDVVIRVENLSKKYVIGRKKGGSSGEGLRHALQDVVSAPFRKLRAAFRSSSFTRSSSAPDEGKYSAADSEEEFWAMKDVSFEVRRGEVLGIIGRNGAGKSTLLKILSRITESTCGRIGIKGRVASLLEVGTGFHPELTGRENIFLNGAILGMARGEVRRKFDEIVNFADVEKFLDTPVKRYSSGMYVRLAFAVAAHLEPEILVVDEVLAVGDAEFQKKCLGKMKDVAQGQGRTVLFVSHNLGAIQSLCTTTLMLAGGKRVFSGSVDGGIKAYRSSSRQSGSVAMLPNSGKPIRLKRVAFLGPDGLETSTWDATKPACFRVAYAVAKDVPRLELSLRLESMTNGLVGTIFAGRSAQGAIPIGKGEHEIEIEIAPQELVPDEYSVTAWLHDPMIELFDYHEKILSFEVINPGSDFVPLGLASLLGASLLDPRRLVVLAPNHTANPKTTLVAQQ